MKKKIIGIFIIFACIFVMCGCDLSNNKKSNIASKGVIKCKHKLPQ